jgi:glutathione synthase/RimK-type ligase-like ATP-grasp enzyme
VWLKASRMPGTAAPPIRDPVVREFVDQDCSAFLSSAWDFLGARCVPGPPSAMMAGQLKAPQLRRAAALGFEIPRTSFTNDPDAFLALHRERSGKIVTKVTGSLLVRRQIGEEFFRYTEPVTTRDVAFAHAISYCPIIVQAYVPKRLELRITVVGDEVFAAEIHSQQSNHTRHDWRRYDLRLTPHRIHELPRATAERCRRLVESLGLRYGAIDLILTPDGRYVFLEINPGGQYLWIEQATGLPISEALCDLLVGDDLAPQGAIPMMGVA